LGDCSSRKTRYLDADRFAERLSPLISQLGVHYLSVITDERMACDTADSPTYEIYGWWPSPDKPPILIFSTNGLGMEPKGPATDRAIANLAVSGITGYLMDVDSHTRGPRSCPNYYNPDRKLDVLTSRQSFCKPCAAKLRAAHPKEIAFFDRGAVDGTKPGDAGTWSAYWYNGYIYSSEIARGLDVLELAPSGLISANEIAAAKLVHLDYFNAQDQPKATWPATFVVARAYVDQLERSNGLSVERLKAVRQELARAEKIQGQARRDALTALASALGQDASTSTDQWKVQKLAGVVTELANTAVTGAQ